MNERETKMHTCKHGHTTEVHRWESGRWSTCRECKRGSDRDRDRKAYKKDYHEALKRLAPDDEIKLNMKAYMKAYHEANRERINAAKRERRKRAKEKRENGDK